MIMTGAFAAAMYSHVVCLGMGLATAQDRSGGESRLGESRDGVFDEFSRFFGPDLRVYEQKRVNCLCWGGGGG